VRLNACRNSKHADVSSFVVDAEVVAYDREKKCLLPFQILSTRKRKVDDGEEDSQKVRTGTTLVFLDMSYFALWIPSCISQLVAADVC
jgi:ATP-dependent DNA ligase